jgi:ribose/xylose/arabinose/galactoside ABC-type transport system permease subunit
MSIEPTRGKGAASQSGAGAGGSIFRTPEWGLVAGILVVLALIYVLEPSHAFFRVGTQRALTHNVALFGVLAVGAAVVIIAGGIDLSVGAVVALSSVVCAKLLTEWLPGAQHSGGTLSPMLLTLGITLTLVMGVVIGLAHAFLINELGLPPFIATLATMAGLRSLAIILSENRSINVSFDSFRVFGSDNRFTVPIFAAVAACVSVMMGRSVLGRHLYALGGNEAAARLSGLPTRRLKAIAYGLSGMLSALGGVLFAGNTGQGKGTMGVSYELFAITAAVVGGCSLAGGVGSIRGTVLGLLLIQIVIKGTGIVVHGIDSTQIEGLVLGTVVILAVAFNQRALNRADWRLMRGFWNRLGAWRRRGKQPLVESTEGAKK